MRWSRRRCLAAVSVLLGALVLLAGLAAATTVAAGNSPFTAVSGSPFATGGTEPYAAAFSPNGRLVAVANYADHVISVFSVGSGGQLSQVAGSPSATDDTPESIAFSPDGTLLATANYGGGGGAGTVVVYTVGAGGSLTQSSINTLPAGSNPASLAFDPDGKLLATANYGNHTTSVFVVNPDGTLTEESGSPFQTGGEPLGVAFNPAGTLLATANSQDGSVSVFSVQGAAQISPISGSPFSAGDGPDSIAFSPNGALLATANSGGDDVSMFTVGGDGTLTAASGSPFAAGSDPLSVAFSPYGGLLAAANNSDNSVSMFSYTSAGTLASVPGSPLTVGSQPHSVAFSPLGGLLVTADYGSNNASVFSYPTGPPSASILAPRAGATFTVGQAATANFSCADAAYGPGIASCDDSNGTATTAGGSATLDTSRPGTFTYTVTATSRSGQTGSATVSYTVTAASPSPTTPTPSAARPSATIVSLKTAGSVATVRIKCVGETGQSCAGTVALTSRVRIRGGAVLAVTAHASHPSKKIVTAKLGVGKATYKVAAGSTSATRVSLNKVGKKLLSEAHTLRTTATFTGTERARRSIRFAARRSRRRVKGGHVRLR